MLYNPKFDLLNPKFDLEKKQVWCKFEQQHKEFGKTKKEFDECKVQQRKGKDLSTKMEFIMVFTNFSVAMDFLSSIAHVSVIAFVYTLMQSS